MIQEKIFVSRSYMALFLPKRFWCKPQNCQLVPKIPDFQNGRKSPRDSIWYVGSKFKCLQLICRCKESFFRINILLRTRVQKLTYFELFIESRRDMVLKVVTFSLKIIKIWKNDLENRNNCWTKNFFAIIYFQHNVYWTCSVMSNFLS